jgi:hypothetical protein
MKQNRYRQAQFKKASSKKGVAYFNTNTATRTASFFDNFATPDSEGLTKKALVAVEGSFEDSGGTTHTFSVDRLNTIADHTNAALESGNVIPVCKDHNKTFDSTVGAVEGGAYTKVIEPTDLPNSKATHLIGKVGLFLEDVNIKANDAVSQVAHGIVNSVSMGLNLDPREHRIMELSLVPIPAIPNMGLFRHKSASFSMDDNEDSQAFTWQDLEADSMAMEELEEQIEDLSEQLWKLLKNIYTSDAINITDINVLKQYVYSALNGYSIRVMDVLGLNDDAALAPQDSIAQMDVNAMQEQQMMQRSDISQPSMAPAFSKPAKGLINFRKATPYLR